MREKSCFFTGHRIISAAKTALIYRAVSCAALDLINQGVFTFISGGARGFDTIAAEAVINLKADYDIKLILFLPCRGHDIKWRSAEKQRIKRVINAADEVRYISEEYDPDCMRRRNMAMALAAEYCLAWNEQRIRSGTAQTIAIANKLGCTILNIADEPWIQLYCGQIKNN